MTQQIFLSSVQKEFAAERAFLKKYIEKNPTLSRFFRVFVFESDVPAADRKTDAVYLSELGHSDIYIGLIGNEYGFEDKDGISPTEREFDEATRLGIQRLIFVKGMDDANRADKEKAFLKKISPELIRKRYTDMDSLLAEVYASLDRILESSKAYRMLPFDAAPCDGATLNDVNEEKVRWFLEKARSIRGFPLAANASVPDILTHLNLLDNQTLNNAGILLFGKTPQKFHLSSEIKCLYWHGRERIKPIASYKVYYGTLFDLSDQAVDFIMSKLDRRIGTRSHGPTAEATYEVPEEIIAEAINNAIAHRDYACTASIQVELYSDRIEVFSPGPMHPGMTLDKLTKVHRSYPTNPLIADPLYLAQYIEEIGSGTTDMIRRCREAGLPAPKFEATPTEFLVTIYRPGKDSPASIPVEKAVEKIVEKAVEKAVEKILLAIRDNPKTTQKQLMEITGLTRRGIEWNLKKLKETGRIVRVGPDKGGHWKIMPETATGNANGNK